MDVDFLIKTFWLALQGLPVTLAILLVSILLSLLPALGLALGRIHQLPGLKTFSLFYLALIRSTPPILLILFFYSLLPSLLNQLLKDRGINIFDLNPIIYAFLIFSLMAMGNLSEIIRSAILSVDKGQMEAGLATGLTMRQTYWRIIFPQALRVALPNLCNLAVNLIKNSSLVFVMTVKDMTAIAKIEAAYGYQYFEAYLVIFILYLMLCGGIQYLFSHWENLLSNQGENHVTC